MTAPALEALAAAKAAGVTIILEGQEIFVEAKNRSPPPHIVVFGPGRSNPISCAS